MFVTADVNTSKWKQVDSLCFSHDTFLLIFLSSQLSHKYTVYNQSIYFRYLLLNIAEWFQLLSKSCSAEFCVVESFSLYFFKLMQMYFCLYKYVITAFSWYSLVFHSEY